MNNDYVLRLPLTVEVRSPRQLGKAELVKRTIEAFARHGVAPPNGEKFAELLKVGTEHCARLVKQACEKIKAENAGRN